MMIFQIHTSVLILTLLLSLIQPLRGQESDLAIMGATLIDGTGTPPQESTTIVIQNDRIATIAPDSEADVSEDARIIDAEGKYVLPSFADMHVHFGSGGLTSIDRDRILRQFLFYGVTTVFSVGGGSYNRTSSIQALKKQVDSGEVLAPRVYATGDMLTVPGSHPVATIMRLPAGADSSTYDWSEHGIALVSTPSEAQSAVQANARAGMDGIKIMVESGPPPFGDDHPQMPPEIISAVVEKASSLALPVVAHVSTLDELEDAIEGDVDAIMHAVERDPFPGPRHWAKMCAQDIFYVPTLSLYSRMMTDRWARQGARRDSFLRSGIPTPILSSLDTWQSPTSSMPDVKRDRLWENLLSSVDAAHDSGVPIALGTDNGMPFIFPGYSVHVELELMVEAGLTPMEALVAATLKPAEMIGADDNFGSVDPGKRADLLILGASPLEDIRNTRSIEVVVKGGKVIDRSSLLDHK